MIVTRGKELSKQATYCIWHNVTILIMLHVVLKFSVTVNGVSNCMKYTLMKAYTLSERFSPFAVKI